MLLGIWPCCLERVLTSQPLKEQADNTWPCNDLYWSLYNTNNNVQKELQRLAKGSVRFEAVTHSSRAPKGLRRSSLKASSGKVCSSMLSWFPWAKIPLWYFTHYWHSGRSTPGGRSGSGLSWVEHRWRASLGRDSHRKIFYLEKWTNNKLEDRWPNTCDFLLCLSRFNPVPLTFSNSPHPNLADLDFWLCTKEWVRVRMVVCLSVRPCAKRETCPGSSPASFPSQLGQTLETPTTFSAGESRYTTKRELHVIFLSAASKRCWSSCPSPVHVPHFLTEMLPNLRFNFTRLIFRSIGSSSLFWSRAPSTT